MEKLAQGFNTAAQDSNSGSRRRESDALSLSHCALVLYCTQIVGNQTQRFIKTKGLIDLKILVVNRSDKVLEICGR